MIPLIPPTKLHYVRVHAYMKERMAMLQEVD